MVYVGSGYDPDRGGDWDSSTRWDLPGSIAPHSVRLLRVLWVSGFCGEPGAQTIFTDLYLRVRVGIVTRTEDLKLDQARALQGTRATSCRGNG